MTFFRSCRDGYMHLVSWGEACQAPLMLAIRLFWGYGFFASGKEKLADIHSVTHFFQGLGIPFAEFNAFLAGWAELAGGLCLMIGIFSRFASLPLIFVMCVAYYTADYQAVRSLFSNPDLFIKAAPFSYLLAALLVFAFGPGKISIDHLAKKKLKIQRSI